LNNRIATTTWLVASPGIHGECDSPAPRRNRVLVVVNRDIPLAKTIRGVAWRTAPSDGPDQPGNRTLFHFPRPSRASLGDVPRTLISSSAVSVYRHRRVHNLHRQAGGTNAGDAHADPRFLIAGLIACVAPTRFHVRGSATWRVPPSAESTVARPGCDEFVGWLRLFRDPINALRVGRTHSTRFGASLQASEGRM